MYYYLLYFGVSRNKFMVDDFERLLKQARAKNEKLGVTGKLLHCEGTFIQLLEGPEEAVLELYTAISKDKRMVAIKLIASGNIKERYYQDWDMAFANISLDEINEFESCAHPSVQEYLESSSAVRLLKLLAKK